MEMKSNFITKNGILLEKNVYSKRTKIGKNKIFQKNLEKLKQKLENGK